jgi:hypothetical protein
LHDAAGQFGKPGIVESIDAPPQFRGPAGSSDLSERFMDGTSPTVRENHCRSFAADFVIDPRSLDRNTLSSIMTPSTRVARPDEPRGIRLGFLEFLSFPRTAQARDPLRPGIRSLR